MLELHVGVDGGRTKCTTVTPTIHVSVSKGADAKQYQGLLRAYTFFFFFRTENVIHIQLNQ